MDENALSYQIIGHAINIHRKFGPGLLESVYEAALAHDLREAGYTVVCQKALPFKYKSIEMNVGYRIDLLVDEKIIVEIKSVESVAGVHFAQLLTYLRLSNIKLGLLINFNTTILRDGIHRVVNNL